MCAILFQYYASRFEYLTNGETQVGTQDSIEGWNLGSYTILRLQRKNLTKQTKKDKD